MILTFIQIIISVLLITGVLLQQRGTGLSSAFGGGGGDGGNVYATRRGAQRFLFYGTIGLAILFLGTAFLQLFVF